MGKENIETWWDFDALKGGHTWQKEIQQGIKRCDFFIVVLSPNSVERDWVLKEITFANEYKKKIIPVIVKECERPISIIEKQYIDFEKKTQKLRSRIVGNFESVGTGLKPAPTRTTMKSKFDPQKHHRRSIRMKGYDYTSAGGYFITIVTCQRECLFGDIVNGEMQLNKIGGIVEYAWNDLPNHYPNIELGTFCIMPNHIHGIILLRDVTVEAGLRPASAQTAKHHGLPEIVRAFKSFSARRANEHLKSPGVPLWQRNYYEHIIRDDDDHNRIHTYIKSNPCRWETDDENPAMRSS